MSESTPESIRIAATVSLTGRARRSMDTVLALLHAFACTSAQNGRRFTLHPRNQRTLPSRGMAGMRGRIDLIVTILHRNTIQSAKYTTHRHIWSTKPLVGACRWSAVGLPLPLSCIIITVHPFCTLRSGCPARSLTFPANRCVCPHSTRRRS